MNNSIRKHYEDVGVNNFYLYNGGSYVNPHIKDVQFCLRESIKKWNLPITSILDLACGSGEVSACFIPDNVTGIDPYTRESYFKRIGKHPMLYSFDDIINGAIIEHRYDLIICSYALHLIEESKLPNLCYALAQISNKMLIISPHKKPDIKHAWSIKGELYINRVRSRYYACND